MDCNLPSSSVHGILQARILEWVAMPSFRGPFQPRDRTHISWSSCTAGNFFFLITEPSGEAHYEDYGIGKTWLIQGGDWFHCRNDWSSSRLSKAVGMIHGDVVALTRTLFTQGAAKPPSEWWEGRCTPTCLVDVCRNSQVISFWMKIFISIWTLECGLHYNRDFPCCVTAVSPAPKTVLSTLKVALNEYGLNSWINASKEILLIGVPIFTPWHEW